MDFWTFEELEIWWDTYKFESFLSYQDKWRERGKERGRGKEKAYVQKYVLLLRNFYESQVANGKKEKIVMTLPKKRMQSI